MVAKLVSSDDHVSLRILNALFQSLQYDLNDQARWEFMFTYSTNLHGAITSTLNNSSGAGALLDDDEEKVGQYLAYEKSFSFF